MNKLNSDLIDVVLNSNTAVVYDYSFLDKCAHNIVKAFPSFKHFFAVKAAPYNFIYSILSNHGIGLEVASTGELKSAFKYQLDQDQSQPLNIIYDCPVKSIQELKYALELGVTINADNLDECKRIDTLLKRNNYKSLIGLRINPQLEPSTINSTSVATQYSKFGEPLDEQYDDIIEAYVTYPWLQGLHVHCGSQGCDPMYLVKGIKKVYDLFLTIQEKREALNLPLLTYFDIGGGLSVKYRPTDPEITFYDYAAILNKECSFLFTNDFDVYTEFGRALVAKAAAAYSRVEYVKESAGVKTAMIHLGADMFLRCCYNPDDWYHHITVLNPDGSKKQSELEPYHIAGPLCFAGDIIARDMMLPSINDGDIIKIHDVGAYTLSMWSLYNSREFPRVFLEKHDTVELIDLLNLNAIKCYI